MRLVITTDCFLPRWDGVARFLSLLLPELKDVQITVFAPDFGFVAVPKNVSLVRFPLVNLQFGDIRFCFPNWSVMREAIRSADVVFNQTIGPVGSAGILIAKSLGKPVVSYSHSVEWDLASRAVKYCKFLVKFCVRLLARYLYNKCSLLLVPSEGIGRIMKSAGIKTRQLVVPLGVSERFVPVKSKAFAKSRVGISESVFVVGFCGRIAREKDLPTLYQAFERFHKIHPSSILLIVGEGLRVPRSKHIIHAGRQDDVVPFLQAMDVFVLPSLTETSSLATMEAMFVGLPVVATPVGGVCDYVVDGKNGLLFNFGDVRNLVVKLEVLFNHPNLRSRLGVEARKSMLKGHSWVVTVKKVKKALHL